MRAIRGKETKAEIKFRKALYAAGVRYMKNYKNVPGTPDIAIVHAKIAVFVDGDFWHGRSWRLRGLPNLEAQFPSRTRYWVNKITRNMARDKSVNRQLRSAGWRVLRFWEKDVLLKTDKCVARVEKALSKVPH